MQQILIVEDDKELNRGLCNALKAEDRQVISCMNLTSASVSFVSGFDMDTYLNQMTCADFIVSGTEYFTYESSNEYISQEEITEIQANTESVLSGCGDDEFAIKTDVDL